jgi:hypothetical protein
VREVADQRLEDQHRENNGERLEAHQRLRSCGMRGGGGGAARVRAPLKVASTCSLKRGLRSANSGLRTVYFL